MPYVNETLRRSLDAGEPPVAPGELNYVLTQVCLEYIERAGGDYTAINDVLGALEGAKLEFYRRFAAPYEDAKREQNGDVYG